MPKITEAELKKHIKQKNFSPIYVIYGTEQMFIKRYTEMLTEAVTGKNPSDFNFHSFGGEINLDELAAAVQIMPFMSEYNCVLITDVFLDSMSADEIDRLKAILAQKISGTVVILSMPSYVPKKNSSALTSIVKKAEKNGSVIKFEQLDQNTLERYIAKWANQNGKMISHINAAKLISYCGTDLNMLKNEVDKICAYSKSEDITLEDINKLASVNLETRIFALSDAVINGQGDKAFQTLDRLFYQKEEPIVMLYVLSNSFIDAYRIRVADECGADEADWNPPVCDTANEQIKPSQQDRDLAGFSQHTTAVPEQQITDGYIFTCCNLNQWGAGGRRIRHEPPKNTMT